MQSAKLDRLITILLGLDQISLESRIYVYALYPERNDVAAWGISAPVSNRPEIIALGRFIVDQQALESNRRNARNGLHWTSDIIYDELAKAGIVKGVDFKTPVVAAVKERPSGREFIKRQVDYALQADSTRELYGRVSTIDRQVHGFAATTVANSPLAYVDGMYSRPLWMQKSRAVFEYFFNKDFRLLAPKLPPKLIKKARRVSSFQLPYAKKLTSTEYHFSTYQDAIKPIEEDDDYEIDQFQQRWRPKKGRFKGWKFQERLDLLIGFNKEFGSEIRKVLIEDLETDPKGFAKHFADRVRDDETQLINLKRTRAHRAVVRMGSAIVGVAGIELLPAPELPKRVAEGLAGFWSLATALLERRQSKSMHVLGYAKSWLEGEIDRVRNDWYFGGS